MDDEEEIDRYDDLVDPIYDDTAHQSAYVFVPSDKKDASERSAKRRKLSKERPGISPEAFTFPKLSHGREPLGLAWGRKHFYQRARDRFEDIIDPILNRCDESTVKAVDTFVREEASDDQGKIPAALVVTGTSATSTPRLLEQLLDPWAKDGICFLPLTSDQATNLRLVLKAIIRGVIIRVDDTDSYQSYYNTHKKAIPLNYDLELLCHYSLDRNLQRIILSFTDSEAFDAHLLAELLSVLSAWRDRIPFVLLFQVATSSDLFEARLPTSAVRLLEGRVFTTEYSHDAFDEIFKSVCLAPKDRKKPSIWPGADATKALLEQSKEQLATPESLMLSMKYGLMSHVFANPLTPLLSGSIEWIDEEVQYICDAIRNTPSFHRHSEMLLADSDTSTVRSLIELDEITFQEASSAIVSGSSTTRELCFAIDNFQKLLSVLAGQKSSSMTFTELYISAMDGDLINTPLFDETLLSLKRAPSDTLSRLLELDLHLPDQKLTDEISAIQKDFQTKLSTTKSSAPTQSAHNPSTSTQTTVSQTNNRISLSSTPKKATALETNYTTILTRYHSTLSEYFTTTLINPIQDLFMSEVFIYSSPAGVKPPLSTAFTPRPRFSIERALSSPSDYLACECCQGIREDEVRATQPATAILWRLWCEAGVLVNVRDLWEAFWGVLKPKDHEEDREDTAEKDDGVEANGDGEGGVVDERMALALFYRSLAELKLLGFVKGSKRKIDCVAKTAWKGL